MSDPAKELDPFFEKIPDAEWNACVGQQGDELNYLEGYIEAAVELVSAVMDKPLIGSRDTLVLPILYNGRHAIELTLKFAINRLHSFGAVKTCHKRDHNILSHWQHLHDSVVGDEAIRELVKQLEPYVRSLAKVDGDGQELRYAENSSGQKSLGDHAVVNLRLVRSSLQSMGALLNQLKYRVLNFEEEYRTGSHTPDCSRSDLREIAGVLGDRSTWRNDSFSKAKAAVMTQYNLSGTRFTNAVNKILASRELSTLVGVEHNVEYLSDEKAFFVLNHWIKVHPVRGGGRRFVGADYFRSNSAAMEEYFKIAHKVDQIVFEKLTLEEFSDLEVLFYIGRESEFGEDYDRLLSNKIESYRKSSLVLKDVHHLISKLSLLDCVARGCTIVGRPSLGEALLKMRPAAQI